ncbi:MAG: hypothetical protein AAFN93_25955 [Bacteroidota bacterium]
MKKLSLYACVLAGIILSSCGVPQEEHDKLKSELESTQFELENSQKYVTALQEVSVLMDSIDAARDELNTDIEAGTSPDDYVSRMNNIRDYISQTEQKIDVLQRELSASDKSKAAYSRQIARLKKDLASKQEEVEVFQAKVNEVTSRNTELIAKLSVRDSILLEKEGLISEKKKELAAIEARIEELLASSKMSEADFYFSRAETMEETAARTKFAGKKKKATLKEAITLYEVALNMGRTDAQERIDQIQKQI